jgi:hypothetical protein
MSRADPYIFYFLSSDFARIAAYPIPLPEKGRGIILFVTY